MNTDHLAALLCRTVGLLLFVLGECALLPVFLFGVQRSGWTSYAPPPPPGLVETLGLFLRYNLPAVGQVIVGAALLLFGRPFGRVLARGLFDHAA